MQNDTHIRLGINCNLGNHRAQRLYYKRDGTPYECMQIGVSSGLINASPQTSLPAPDAHRTRDQTRKMVKTEKKGIPVDYPLPDSLYHDIRRVNGLAELEHDLEEFFPLPDDEDGYDISVRDLQKFNFKRNNACCFGPWKPFVQLHDTFDISTVRAVFDPRDLAQMFEAMMAAGRFLFLMQSLTIHLAPVTDKYVLCEVDFRRQRLTFYHYTHDNRHTLRFYAESIWNQCVFPGIEKKWRIELFPIHEDSLAVFFLIMAMRGMDWSVDTLDLLLGNLDARVGFYMQSL